MNPGLAGALCALCSFIFYFIGRWVEYRFWNPMHSRFQICDVQENHDGTRTVTALYWRGRQKEAKLCEFTQKSDWSSDWFDAETGLLLQHDERGILEALALVHERREKVLSEPARRKREAIGHFDR